MATRKKVSQLPDISSLTIDDIFPISDDPSGSPISKKASIQTLYDLFEKGYFAREVDNVTDLASEEAGTGYVCIVRDLDRGGVFKAVNGGTSNNVDIFASATSGWTWQKIGGAWIDIKTAGAVGDDSTDNYSVIQSVLDRLETIGGGVCYVPHGVFRVSQQLLIPSKVSLIGGGYGSEIKATWTGLGDHPDYYIIANKNRAHFRYINAFGEATQNTGSLTTGESLVTDDSITIANLKLTATAYANADYTSNTFSFTSGGNTVTDSANQFLIEGFSTDQKLYVIDGTGNIGAYGISSVTAGTITITSTFSSTTSGQTRRLVGFRHRGGIWLGRVEDCKIQNVWFDGAVNFAWNTCVWGENNRVEKVKINCAQEVTEDGIDLVGSNNFITDCYIKCGDDPVIVKSCQYEEAENNIVSNVIGDTTYGQLRVNPNYKTVDGVYISNCKFTTGRIRGRCYEHYFENGADETNVKNIFVSNVDFYHDPDGVHSGLNATAFLVHGGTNLNFNNITLRNAKNLTGGSYFIVDIRNGTKVFLSNFKVIDPQTYLADGINIVDSTDFKIEGCFFDNTAVEFTNVDRAQFEGNSLPGIASGAEHAVRFIDCDNIICTDNNTYGSAAYDYGCRILGTSVSATVSGNQFDGATRCVSLLSDLSASSYIGDNGPVIETGTITSGAANADGARILKLKGEGDLADILLDITRGQDGQFLKIMKHADTPSIEVRNTGVTFPIALQQNRTLTTDEDYILLFCDGEKWRELDRDYALNLKHFGAKGDDSTDDTEIIQSAADLCSSIGCTLYIPYGTYKTTDFINFYDINIIGDGRERSVIKSYATNKPVGVFTGSHFSISGFGLRYDSLKTDKSCNCMLVSGYSGSGTQGYYYGSIRDIALQYGTNGYKCPSSISTTLSATASSGATTIQVASVGSGTNQSILAGTYITVTLDSAATQVVQVSSVSGTTLTLADSLSGDATSGNSVSMYESVVFTNTFDNIYIKFWTDFGFYHAGSGTGSSFPNIYLANSNENSYGSCVGGFYCNNFSEGFIGQINVEWCQPSESLIQLNYNNGFDISSLRTEGIKLINANTSLLQVTSDNTRIGTWSIDNWEVPDSAGIVSLVKFPTGSQTDRDTRVDIGSLNVKNGKFETPNNVYYCQSNNWTESLYIHSMGLRADAGMKRRGQFVTPSLASQVLKKLDPFFDESVVAYGTKLDISFIGDKTMYSRTRRASYEKAVVGNSSESLSTAVCGINTSTGGGGTDIATPEVLSALTGYDKMLRLTVETGIENTIFNYSSDSKLYFEVSTAQADVAVSGSSVSVQRFNDATNGFGIQEYTWSTSHNLNVGDLIQTVSFTDTDFNHTAETVVEVPSSTKFRLYKYDGTTKSLTADTGGLLYRVPSVDVKLYGEDWERPNY